MRSCSPLLIPGRHVGSVVPNPRDPAAPSWYLVGMYDLLFRIHEVLQPRPDTAYACLNCCFLLVRSCSHIQIPRSHVRYDVPYPWDPAAPFWYPLGMYDLLFRTHEILKPDLMFDLVFRTREILQPGAPTWYLVGMIDSMVPTHEILQPRPDASYACWISCSLLVRS